MFTVQVVFSIDADSIAYSHSLTCFAICVLLQDWTYPVDSKQTRVRHSWGSLLSPLAPSLARLSVTVQSTPQSAPSTYYILYWRSMTVDGTGQLTEYTDTYYAVP